MYTLTKADMLAQLAGLQQEIHQLHRSARQDRRHFFPAGTALQPPAGL